MYEKNDIPLGIVYEYKKELMGQSKSGEIHLRNYPSHLAPIWIKRTSRRGRTCRNNLYFLNIYYQSIPIQRTSSGDIVSVRQNADAICLLFDWLHRLRRRAMQLARFDCHLIEKRL